MIIAIDIDNTINTLCNAVLSVYNEDSGDNLTVSNIKSYYIEEFVKPQYKENFYHYFLDKRVWKRIELIEGCQKYISKLFNDGHKIIFVTSTEPENLKKKANWLSRNFPYINIRKSLFACPIKQYLAGVDVLIDDAPQNVVNADYFSILCDYPWNKEVEIDNFKIYRCNNWEEIYNTIVEIERREGL